MIFQPVSQLMKLKAVLKYNLDFKIVLVAVAYYMAAVFGYFLAFESTHVLPTWPPSGIAFALIILLGRKSWPGITIGALIANVMAYWNMPELPASTVIAISTYISIGNTLEALLGNFLIQNWIKSPFPFEQTKNAFRFLFIAVLITFLGSGIGTVSLLNYGILDQSVFLTSYLSMWVGNVVGILLFTPFILALVKKYKFTLSLEKGLELALFALGGITLTFLFQIQEVNDTFSRALPFIVLPFLLWLAFRFQLVVSMSVVMLISLLAIHITTLNIGPFVLEDAYSSILLLQIYIIVVSISTIILAATVRERTEAQDNLVRFNENLEEMVDKRTKQLKDQIETRKKAEENLKKTNEELSKRNVELDNFVYSVSHDLRAPIASVLGLINLAKQDEDTGMKDKYFEMINNSALQQDNFIREILDQSRNTRLDIKREKVFFKQIIDETFDQLKHATHSGKPVDKVIKIEQDEAFYTDSWRIKVMLNNVISNAIRYRNGRNPLIKVEVKVEKDSAKLIVEDNGRGISKQHLDKVCEMFYRATDDNAGSGLGLYIVKETVDKLQGEIKIESEEGKGTKVIFDIPEVKTATPEIAFSDN